MEPGSEWLREGLLHNQLWQGETEKAISNFQISGSALPTPVGTGRSRR